MKHFGLPYVFLLVSIVLSSCATSNNQEESPYAKIPPDELYVMANNELDRGSYEKAAQMFNELEKNNPFTQWAEDALLKAGYAYYMNGDYNDSNTILSRYIEQHPSGANIDYAYYLRGSVAYNQVTDIRRDQRNSYLAYKDYAFLLEKYPKSKYAEDAKNKLSLAYNNMAAKEIDVGRFYQLKGNFIASIIRFQMVVTDFGDSEYVAEALYRIAEGYISLGLQDEAVLSIASLVKTKGESNEWSKRGLNLINKYKLQNLYKQLYSKAKISKPKKTQAQIIGEISSELGVN